MAMLNNQMVSPTNIHGISNFQVPGQIPKFFFLVLEGLVSPEITEPNEMFLIYSYIFLYTYIYI